MVEVQRVTALWTGWAGEPGVSKFSFRDVIDDTGRNAAGNAVRTFFNAISAYLLSGVSINIQPTVDGLDMVTGELLTANTMSSVPTTVASTAISNAHAGGTGLVLTWFAAGVFQGKRIQGRTFIIPAAPACFEVNGTLTETVRTAVKAAGDALIATAAADLSVWNRTWTKPPDPRPKNWHPEPTAGIVVPATSCIVKDYASSMRSRRK